MRRDDLLARTFTTHGRPVSDAEALDVIGRAAALRHWLTEECRRCDGAGGEYYSDVQDDREWIPCLPCEGRGWLPKRDVEAAGTIHGLSELLVPLDWLRDMEN